MNKKKLIKEQAKLLANKEKNQRILAELHAREAERQSQLDKQPMAHGPFPELEEEDVEWGGEYHRVYQPNECYFAFDYKEEQIEDSSFCGLIIIAQKKAIDNDCLLHDLYQEMRGEYLNSKLPYLECDCMESSWELPHNNLVKIKQEMEAEGFIYNPNVKDDYEQTNNFDLNSPFYQQ